MLVIAIIALVLSVAGLSLGVFIGLRLAEARSRADTNWKSAANDIVGLKQSVRDMEKDYRTQVYDGLPGVSYDVEKKTLWVNGNMFATGAVSAFEKKPLEE